VSLMRRVLLKTNGARGALVVRTQGLVGSRTYRGKTKPQSPIEELGLLRQGVSARTRPAGRLRGESGGRRIIVGSDFLGRFPNNYFSRLMT
jgi:hypothetical protein